jgi:hypothetical protein
LLHDRQENQAFAAGWSSPVARQAHNLKVVSSNLTPATKITRQLKQLAGFCFREILAEKMIHNDTQLK